MLQKVLISSVILIIFLGLVPALVHSKPYQLHVLIIAMFHVVLALALNFIMRTGQVPLCQAAFVGIGAYTSTLLVMKAGASFWVSLPVAGLVGAVVGFLVGLPTLKIRGIYFAMATFAFGEIIRLIFIGWVELFGGANGISGIPSPNSIRLPFLPEIVFESKVSFYYLTILFLFASIVFFYRLTYSRVGRACKAIGESEILGECIGINSMRYKVMAFTICSWFAALVGAMYAHYMRFIAPQEFGFWKSVECIIHVIVGGLGTFWGPIVGAAVFTFLPEWLRIAERWELVIYGLVLILTILFVPDGIWGFGGRVLAKVSKS